MAETNKIFKLSNDEPFIKALQKLSTELEKSNNIYINHLSKRINNIIDRGINIEKYDMLVINKTISNIFKRYIHNDINLNISYWISEILFLFPYIHIQINKIYINENLKKVKIAYNELMSVFIGKMPII